MNPEKYRKQYRLPPAPDFSWITKECPDACPVWCSVDLRDGNQALANPMSIMEKLSFFDMLIKMGFKEIEVGFPAASDTEFRFVRALIDEKRIPDDVTIQVLTQARESIIKRTAEAIAGARAIVHMYSASSPVFRKYVFGKSRDETVAMVREGAALIANIFKDDPNVRFEFSPECFPETEPDFALRVCSAALDEWRALKSRRNIINLPVTVEYSMPHIFASQVNYLSKNLPDRDDVVLSVHAHNDRGCAVAATEMALLAGAERVEGTLFGNGERAGNADLITLALNMYALGIDPGLDLSHVADTSAVYEKMTGMQIPERMPYTGKLTFTAFSGSHQDAIAKGMRHLEASPGEKWCVPYLPIDPTDIGRESGDRAIRINSQSGRGGIGYILEHDFGLHVPRDMQFAFSRIVKHVSDERMHELTGAQVYELFEDEYVNVSYPLALEHVSFAWNESGSVTAKIELTRNGEPFSFTGDGTSRFAAAAGGIRRALGIDFTVFTHLEHALELGVEARVVTYIGIESEIYGSLFGAGTHTDIIISSIRALLSALNRGLNGKDRKEKEG